jgi:hypothetical protein
MAEPDPSLTKELQKESNSRLADARQQKAQVEMDMRECYFFSAPRRARMVTSQSAMPNTRLHDEGLLQTSLFFELTQDFVTVVLNAFMPQANPWCERRAGAMVPTDAWKQVEDRVKQGDVKIFDAMKASNLYPEVAKAFYPDLAIGTVGLWIDDPRPAESVVVAAVPLRELEINLGPFGEIDDRFVVRHTKNRHVKALLPGISLPAKLETAIKEKPGADCEIRWGFWRLWDRVDDECWQHVVMVGKDLVKAVVLQGAGCCPLVVGRFNANADWAYADGPLMQALPDARQVDELEGQKISHVELSLTPPLTYPDDSFAAVEQGIEPGAAYPIRPGSEGAVKRMYDPGSMEAGIYEMSDKESRLRRMFFVDFPQQRGDTPPTATQWLDEMQLAQRRIGTPGLSFWREVPAKIFLRFQYLLEKAGTLEAITVDGKHVSLQPYNPAERAAEQQEVMTNVQTLGICMQTFPEEAKIQIDGGATMRNIVKKTRADLIVFRDPDQIKQAVANISQLVKGKPGEADASDVQGQGLA